MQPGSGALGGRGRQISQFEARLACSANSRIGRYAYRANSRIGRYPQRSPIKKEEGEKTILVSKHKMSNSI